MPQSETHAAALPFCACTCPADCPFGHTGRRFELCRGTDDFVPPARRSQYRDLMTAPPGSGPLARPAEPLADIDTLEAMSEADIDRLAGCSGCSGQPAPPAL